MSWGKQDGTVGKEHLISMPEDPSSIPGTRAIEEGEREQSCPMGAMVHMGAYLYNKK